MDAVSVEAVVRELSDIELAALVCLVADQHCIIRAPEHLLDDLESEIKLVAARTFGLSYASVNCSVGTTLNDFSDAVLEETNNEDGDYENPQSTHHNAAVINHTVQADISLTTKPIDGRCSANVIIARDLDRACDDVQIQALELMRSRRIYTRTAVHAAPKRFLFVALLSTETPGPPFLTPHLNDYFFISHTHDPSDSLANLATHTRPNDQPADTASLSSQTSVLHHQNPNPHTALITPAVSPPPSNPQTTPTSPTDRTRVTIDKTLTHLQTLTAAVRTTAELRRHTHNIVTFLRLHRAVAGGISALAARHLVLLTRILPTLHSRPHTTPSLVALAARKVFPHRLVLATAETERSRQWGSSYEAVAWALEGVAVEAVVEEVLRGVRGPL